MNETGPDESQRASNRRSTPSQLQWDHFVPDRVRKVVYSILGNPGRTDFVTRRAIFDYAMSPGDIDLSAVLPSRMRPYINKVIAKPSTITDQDVADLRVNGLSEDHIFEMTLFASVGAALGQYNAGLRALHEAGSSEQSGKSR